MRELSISDSFLKEPWNHTNFKTIEANNFRELAKIILNYTWSPIVWKFGKRKTENFKWCDYLVLDFDDGRWGIDHAIEWCKNNDYAALIGSTKSHLIEKDGAPPHPRFRVVIPWGKRCNDYPTHRQNMERIAQEVPTDPQCKDGARMYQPCKEILWAHHGKLATWKEFIPPPPPRTISKHWSQYGVIPEFIHRMINESKPVGSRNKHCFRIAAKMAEFGFSESDCIKAVLSCKVALDEREKKTAAKSGFVAGTKRR